MVILRLQFLNEVIDVPVVQSYRFSRAGVEETVVLPQLQLVEKIVAIRRRRFLS